MTGMFNIALTCMSLLLPLKDNGVCQPANAGGLFNTSLNNHCSQDSTPTIFPRLTVNPKKDATGKENKTYGTVELDSFKGYYLHVPESAVGKTRVPLVLVLHGGGRKGADEIYKLRVLADKYGMIILAATSLIPGQWDVIEDYSAERLKLETTDKGLKPTVFKPRDVVRIDSAIKYVLRTQAIDPNRIALLGFSDGGSYSLFLGRSNLDVFSRIAPLSGLIPFDVDGPVNKSTQFFLSGGIGERDIIKQVVRLAAVLRSEGYSVKTQVGMRGHVDNVQDQNFVWEWLVNSWKNPKVTSMVPKENDSPVLLTADELQSLTEFWREFSHLHDDIRNKFRMRSQREVWIRIGSEWSTVVMMDLQAVAKKYPEVLEILKKSNLTAEQADSYRRSVIEAYYTVRASMHGDAMDSTATIAKSIKFKPLDRNSILNRNIEFILANQSLFQKLAKQGILNLQ